MELSEMSNEFDVLFNNIMSNQAPGVDEFEKSVLMTKSQYQILEAYHEPRGNKYLKGFDGSEQRQMNFSKIAKTCMLSRYDLPMSEKFDIRSKTYIMPDDCFIITNEEVIESDMSKIYTVMPITYLNYASQMTKPYKYPPKNIVWRLITQQKEVDTGSMTICEIIGKFNRNYGPEEGPIYKMRYLRKPNPIILVDLSDLYEGLTIEGLTGPCECELPEDLHHAIVQRAVELAAASYDPAKVNVLTGIGNVSSTNLGIIPQTNKD